MKRIISALLAGIIIFCAGCADSQFPDSETTLAVTDANSESENDANEHVTTESDANKDETTPDETTADLPSEALGKGIGVNPGRVTWAYNPAAFTWNGGGYWWLEKNFDSDVVKQMMTDIICELAGSDDVDDALTALFTNHNERVNGKSEGYTAGQKIAIKLNMNVAGTVSASNNNTQGYFPAPVSIRALLEILVGFGIAPEDITLFDASRMIPTYMQELCSAGELDGVNFVYYDGTTNNPNDAVADTTKPVQWSIDLHSEVDYADYNGYPTCNTTYYPTCVTEAAYLINFFNLRGHNLAGFTASAKNHFGTVMPGYTEADGTISFPQPFRANPPSYSGLHHYAAALDYNGNPKELWDIPQRPMGSYSILVDLMSNADCGQKTFLYICDGLASTVNQGKTLTVDDKWCSAPFGDGTKSGSGWTASLFASQDPVAIDSVALDFLTAERDACRKVGDNSWNSVLPDDNTAENYLIESALADNPPSGVAYQDGYGNPVGSLGVFQHWNNAEEKLYGRNLGDDEGIELIAIEY